MRYSCRSAVDKAPRPMSVLATSSSVGTGAFRLSLRSNRLVYFRSNCSFRAVDFFQFSENQACKP